MTTSHLRPLTGVVLAAVSANATAQQPSEETPRTLPTVTVSGQPFNTLDSPASTATRLGTTIRDTPASVEVLTQEAMQERGKRTTTEALEAATGIT